MKRIILLLALFASTCTLKASALTTKQALLIAASSHQRKHRHERTHYQTPTNGRSRRGPKGKEATRLSNHTKDKRSEASAVNELEDANKKDPIIPFIEIQRGNVTKATGTYLSKNLSDISNQEWYEIMGNAPKEYNCFEQWSDHQCPLIWTPEFVTSLEQIGYEESETLTPHRKEIYWRLHDALGLLAGYVSGLHTEPSEWIINGYGTTTVHDAHHIRKLILNKKIPLPAKDMINNKRMTLQDIANAEALRELDNENIERLYQRYDYESTQSGSDFPSGSTSPSYLRTPTPSNSDENNYEKRSSPSIPDDPNDPYWQIELGEWTDDDEDDSPHDSDDQNFEEWILEAEKIKDAEHQAYHKYTYEIARDHTNAAH